MRTLETQQEQVIGSHDAPVKALRVLEDGTVLSGSWDRTLKLWNVRQPNAITTIALPERVYAMDVSYPLLVVGCADRHVQVYDLTRVQHNLAPVHSGPSMLKMQTRSIACFPDKKGYALGSIEGRVSVVHLEDSTKTFSFKCHRNEQAIYPVNAMHFHPFRQGVFATCGGDGVISFWDTEVRQRLKNLTSCRYPITAGKFDPTGKLFAYSVSDDWSRGHEMQNSHMPKEILIHRCQENELARLEKKR
jgi:mRNA export factor